MLTLMGLRMCKRTKPSTHTPTIIHDQGLDTSFGENSTCQQTGDAGADHCAFDFFD